MYLSAFQQSAVLAASVDMWSHSWHSLDHVGAPVPDRVRQVHILQNGEKVVDEVRRAEFFRKGGAARDLVRGKRWLLLISWLNLDRSKRRKVDHLEGILNYCRTKVPMGV